LAVVGGRIGTFTLSLDFELAWGSWQRDSVAVEVFATGAECALALERLAREYDFAFTWAVVSALHDLTIEQLQSAQPHDSVAVLRPGLGPFRQALPSVGTILRAPDAWLAPHVVDAIRSSPVRHDVGSHSYFHAAPTTAAGLARDLAASRKSLGQARLESLVYPRDQVLFPEVVAGAGLTSYRSAGASWYLRKTGKPHGFGKVAHTLDQVLGRPAGLASVQGGRPAVIGSSAILTLRTGARRRIPYRLVRRRFVQPLYDAAATGGLYHLWTHPWNLALPASDALLLLEDVCAAAKSLVDAGKLRVQTMAELARGGDRA